MPLGKIMNRHTTLSRACAAALVALACTAHTQANAEDRSDDAAKPQDAARLDDVLVTGSNISGVDIQDSQPIKIFSREDIERYGARTVTDLLRELSQRGGGTGNFTEANSGSKQGDTPAGFAGISLRGLGTASTLTLVNGRRIAAASFASGSENFVDVNAIPIAAIDRIEVLTTGASAIYGADAVAGVVNFILRRDFEGVRVDVSYADSEADTDEARYNANIVAGSNGSNWRGMVIVDYFQRNALFDRDRGISAVEPRPSQQGIFPSFNDLFAQEFDLVEAGCPDAQRFDGRPGFPISRFGAFCELNRNAFTATVPATERIGAYSTFSFEFDNGIEWFNEFAYQNNDATANSEPAPFSSEEVPFDHPGMPEELRIRLLDAGVDPDFPIFAWGRFTDPRTISNETESYRWLSGLRGAISGWDWETASSYSRSESSQVGVAGIVNVAKFRAGLRGELCADGRLTCTPGIDGLYFDPFNGQAANDPAVISLLNERVPRNGLSELYFWDAKISGTWGELASRPISWAFGTEVRREEISDSPSPLATNDPVTNEVPVFGFGSTAASAERTQYAAFAEVLVPLHASLDLRLAGRLDHYDDFGSDFNPAVSVRWQPSDSVLLRGGWNSSFRAPSLAQSGAGLTLGSGSLPCSPGSEFFNNFCDQFADDDAFLTEINGNPDLRAETADTWFVGVAFNLGRNTSFTADYWRFVQRNLVDIDELELFRLALQDPTLVVPEGSLGAGEVGIETRDGSIGSPIEEVHLALTNIGRQKTDGIDFSLEHRIDSERLGDLRLFADATWTNSFKRQESCDGPDSSGRRGIGECIDGARLVERVGEFRFPDWVGSIGVDWSHDAISTRFWANYTDSYFDDDTREDVPAGRKVASWTVFNLSLTWDISKAGFVNLTTRNLFDKDPPLSLGSATNVDLFNHNTLGRWFTLSYTHRF
ncbi:MAG: hypothetical protein COZ47_05175 [Lysobacterales bacterium CG_4_10_14_3_um_filter_64_11]|nr:MAG: hypothetical protein COZ47_05175 [Xanthomonadales bacterium CG_4_10_14_3_um_filter_64_11]